MHSRILFDEIKRIRPFKACMKWNYPQKRWEWKIFEPNSAIDPFENPFVTFASGQK